MRSLPSVVLLACFACGCTSGTGTTGDAGPSNTGTNKPAPTCVELQTQINGCPGFTQAQKDSLGAFCANASEACRACLDGHICGVTEQCDPACGKK